MYYFQYLDDKLKAMKYIMGLALMVVMVSGCGAGKPDSGVAAVSCTTLDVSQDPLPQWVVDAAQSYSNPKVISLYDPVVTECSNGCLYYDFQVKTFGKCN